MGRRQGFVLQDGFNLRALHPGKPGKKLLNRVPSRRFSNSAAKSARVPWNTHAPLPLSEWRSMA